MQVLSKTFRIVKKQTICLFECLAGFSERKCFEVDVKNIHIINYRLKKAKRQSNEKDIIDTNIVLKQYKTINTDKIIVLLDKVIDTFDTLIPKYFNKIASLQI